ncbi:MAG: hydroxymethylbilane synthase [Nitrospirota bacterium]|nr:hydroxymethylbilane synthase [Nitrospirota bacterium]
MKTIRIGTRGSQLALWQANWVKSELENRYPGIEVTLTKIKTTGDKILDVPLAKVGGKGLFVKEIEEALLKDEVDIAVHSMKDVPTELPDVLHLSVITEREDPRDALLSKGVLFKDLPRRANVGTSSLRRQCQLFSLRPDLTIHQLRGNLDSRVNKLVEGQFDAIILAAAGLRRLGWASHISEYLAPEVSLPAIGQGALGIECRKDRAEVNEAIAFLGHPVTRFCVDAERALLKRLEGGCQVPIAAYGTIEGSGKKQILTLRGLVGSVSGDRIIKQEIKGTPAEAEKLGVTLAENLLAEGADRILEEVYGKKLS